MANLNNLKIDGQQIVERVELIDFRNEATVTMATEAGAIEEFAFDDNGGEPDGDMWLLPMSDVTVDKLPANCKRVNGWQINRFTENANYSSFCGFTSRRVAYTTSAETAEAIARDEISIANENN